MSRFIIAISLFLASFYLRAQSDTTKTTQTLDTIEINGFGNPKPIFKIAKTIRVIKLKDAELQQIESLDELLQTIATVDVRTRGNKGVQADISIRGGNFEQVLVLLNGIKINNPQTGHHHLDLPVDFSMLDRIEIIEGAGGQIFGANAYSGVINLITKNPQKKQARTTVKAGQYGYLKTDLSLAHSFQKLSVYNGFSFQKSNGYLTNDSINNTDFYGLKYFINLHYNHSKYSLDLQTGYHQKDFGAHSFYTAKYPWQYEKTKGYFISLSSKFGKKINWKPFVSYRVHFDEFQLFRESIFKYNQGYFVHNQDTAQFAPGIYYRGHNYHKITTLAAGIKVQFQSKAGQTSGHLHWNNDAILSNKLGKQLNTPVTIDNRQIYDKYDERNYWEVGINHSKKWQKLQLGAGINLLYSKLYNTRLSGGLYMSFFTSNFTHYINVSSASRLPGFTDLYYQGPQNIGNPDLQPESAQTYELGTKWHQTNISAHAGIFYRNAQHTIDWIKYQPDDKWQTQNLTQLNTFGIEADCYIFFEKKFIQKIKFSYAYLHMNKNTDQNIISKYALDYLKHKLNIELHHRFLFNSSIHWTAIYKNRNGQYLNYIDNQYRLFDYQPYFLTHVKINKSFDKTRFAIGIENIFNIAYNDLSYVKMPGRWLIFELRYKIH